MSENWLNIKQAANYLGVSVWWLWQKRKDDNGPPFERWSPRKIMYCQDKLDEWRHNPTITNSSK